MNSITYHSDGTVTLSATSGKLYGPLDHDDIQGVIDHLQSLGYIVIAPSRVEYCRYVSSQCPHCGQPVSEVRL